MSTIGHARFFPRTAAIALAVLATLAIAAPVLAKPGGNSFASAACADRGYLDWTDAAGNAFRNAGACVSYAAHGGTLVPLVVDPVNPFSVSYSPSGTNGFQATVTGTGLEPNSAADVVLSWGSVQRTLGDVTDASGNVAILVSSVCSSLGSPLTAVAALGIPVDGEQTEYPLPLPDAGICAPPA